ncbi:glycerophosphodiester phosphodiesterase [Halomonas sp. MCCC 1A17488]|uniref:Glycerophosphodiester phosphodiesterase n=1 Tax=Billgrantia sulfidoxydans TaxID=2733484 RepID=A0ABX7W3J5_9GAMM|nr:MULTISPECIES: glycerophosphodiester phosphodiesterase family protein [Halomonas]MCE8015322.1 glycerophosphodiester phosphodiesterase [Halomonas sp. MCCC 1A17488]MCG3238655.1 glycerophosphodiester phosphodiesterase [Halomonas sp. MCCC 1A17488]QPP51370.1 glycerophosphoryl diester phosphodiesterase membrane domain-containing protein [Halomonas sp. SS10-MC5]QTP54924.1 glycerophosphodiester phosphodiesterase [Halomonas sulfidoxydans]
MTTLGVDVLRSLREHLRPLVAYHLFFTLLASSLLLPGVAWSLTSLLRRFDRPVVTNAALLDLLLSPGGVLWLLAAIGLTFLVLYLQQAGMILVAVKRRDNHYQLAFIALWQTLRRLPVLAGLVVLQVGTHLLLLIPVALLLGWLYEMIIGGLDPYYVLRMRPPALWYFLATAAPLTLAWALTAGWLYVRWILALPVATLENLPATAALKRSRELTRGHRGKVALVVISVLLVIVALPLLASALFDHVFTPMLWWLPERNAVLIPAMLAYVTGYVLATLAITFVGIAANALLSACLYLRLAHREPRPAPPPPDAHPGRLAWGVELAVLLFAVAQAWWIVNSFELRDDVAIIAHRGSSVAAPENTLPAIERATADRAHYVEIDVRLTADGEVVLYHDSSLQRLTGDPRLLHETPLEELRQFDVGSWFGDAFVGERIPTLDEAFAAVRGKSALMIDMKPDPGREADLVEAVLDALQRETEARRECLAHVTPAQAARCGSPDVSGETRLAVMSTGVLEMLKEREPDLRVTLLAQLVMPGTLDRRSFDALGLRHNRITDNEIRLARELGYEVHAWTVNDRSRMSQMIDLGVDAIITDHPDRLAELIRDRRELSDGAILLVKLRNWLRR